MRSKIKFFSILLSVCLSVQASITSTAYALDTGTVVETENMESIVEATDVQGDAVPFPQDEMDNIEVISTEETEAELLIQQSPAGQSATIPAFVQAPIQLYSNSIHTLTLGYPDNRYFSSLVWSGSTDYGVEWKQTWNDTDFSVPAGWLWMLEDWRDTYGNAVYYTADGHRTSGAVFGITGLIIANWKTGITNSFYDCEQYMQLNPDVTNGGYNTPAQAWAHWLNYGINEGRRTSYGFNPQQYREMYGDLAGIFGTDMPSYYQHYGQYGAAEGRWGMNLNVYFNANGGSCGTASIPACYNKKLGTHWSAYNTVNALPTPVRAGYVFDGWYTAASGGTQYTAGSICPWWSDVTLYAHWHAGSSNYKVYHYQQDVDGSGYTLVSTQTLSDTTDKTVTPARNSYTGFTAPAGKSVKVAGDGKASVSYYYTRNQYSVTVNGDSGIASTSGGGTYYYGASVKTSATAKNGYTISGVTSSPAVSDPYSFTMPAGNVTVTFSSKATTAGYTVRHYKEKIGGGGYELAQTESFTGTVGSSIPAAVKNYAGYTSPAVKNVTVTADGKAAVDYYYAIKPVVVSVPKTLIASNDGYTEFSVAADNEIGTVSVTVPGEIHFVQSGKSEVISGRITMSETTLTLDRHKITGTITTDGLTAGSWQANFYIGIHFSL